jgi:exonuclease VII small subunit
MPSRCVYTVLTGGYECLNEQAIARESSLPFICLTDDPDLTSDSWTIRQIEPTFAMDPIRSQRDLKIRPHVHLPEFDQSLYIDNSVILKARPETLFDSFLADLPMAIPTHSFRETLLDEFIAVIQAGLDDSIRIFEQINHYSLADPALLNEKPYWSAILLRDHHDSGVRKWAEIWAAHVFRYSRRDQLSINLAFRNAALTPNVIDVDNYESWFHSWPVTIARDRSKGMRDVVTALSPMVFRLRKAELELAEKERAGEALAREVEGRLEGEQIRRSEISDALAAGQRELEHMRDELETGWSALERSRGELDEARRELDEARREMDEAQRELDEARRELAESATREARLWARYVALRKRAVLRLPRWLVRQG